MRTAAFVCVASALFVAGCGSSSPKSPAEALEGSWISQVNSVCDYGVNFGPGDAISVNTVCVDQSTLALDLEENEGTYTADAAKIYVTLTQSTCTDAQVAYYEPYVLTPGSLALTESTDVVYLTPNADTGGSGVATLGCFRAGAFTTSPLAPI